MSNSHDYGSDDVGSYSPDVVSNSRENGNCSDENSNRELEFQAWKSMCSEKQCLISECFHFNRILVFCLKFSTLEILIKRNTELKIMWPSKTYLLLLLNF